MKPVPEVLIRLLAGTRDSAQHEARDAMLNASETNACGLNDSIRSIESAYRQFEDALAALPANASLDEIRRAIRPLAESDVLWAEAHRIINAVE